MFYMHIQSRIKISVFFLAALAIAGTCLSGCRKQASDLARYQPVGDTKTDTLFFFNLLPDSSQFQRTGYVLYINDSIRNYFGRGLGVDNLSACYGVPPAVAIASTGGRMTIKVAQYSYRKEIPPVSSPDPARVVCQSTVSIPAHSGSGNVLLYNDAAGTPSIRYMPVSTVDPGPPAPGTFKVRVVNFGYELKDGRGYIFYSQNSKGRQFAVQLQMADSSIVQGNENIAFAGDGPYRQFDYGTYQFLVYNLTTRKYISNSGPMNDIAGTFNISPILLPGIISDPTGNAYNFLYPNFTGNYIGTVNRPTLHVSNTGSYQFSAGGCYTIFVVGSMYAVTMDRQYGPGDLDNYAKVQVVNAAPGQSDLQVTISGGSRQMQIPALPFGGYTPPVIVPAGDVTCTFSAKGQTLYTYNLQVPRLGNYMLCYSTDLKKLPFVFSKSITLTPDDYIFYTAFVPAVYELNKVSCLNLCPDAGNLYFTNTLPVFNNTETPSGGGDLPYKGMADFSPQDGFKPATRFNIRLSAARTDTLANQAVANLLRPFPILPAPGTFSLVAAGLLNADDSSKALRMIMVRHTNYIPKAQ